MISRALFCSDRQIFDLMMEAGEATFPKSQAKLTLAWLEKYCDIDQ